MTKPILSFFFFNDTATTEIYTLSLHDALPISPLDQRNAGQITILPAQQIEGVVLNPRCFRAEILQQIEVGPPAFIEDRKSTRLNSSHGYISYAVFCLKKKNASPTDTVTSSPAC